MCGRFTLKTPPDQWSQLLLPLLDMPAVVAPGWVPRFNIAPTQNIVAIATDCDSTTRFTAYFRWGLVPSWSDDLSIGNRMINARAETISEKRSFVGPLNKRRCAIIADGYYEWKADGKQKQPYWIHPTDGGVFAMAGLWENNRRATGESIRSCTIITTSANETLANVHDRMPVVLNGQNLIDWLDVKTTVESAVQMLVPSSQEYFQYHAVDKRVNNARVDDADCLKLL